jgi:hypothetical protein
MWWLMQPDDAIAKDAKKMMQILWQKNSLSILQISSSWKSLLMPRAI